MRRNIRKIALMIACAALVFVLVCSYFEERYPAALYFTQIRAIDDDTSKPVDFNIKWDYEAISPFFKGSGPARIHSNEDMTITVALVGLHLKEGLPLTITADGYNPIVLNIGGSQSGFLDGAAQVE